MSENLVFSYSVEEHDGKLVITLDGQMAAPIMQDIAANSARVAAGRTSVASWFPFSLLASNAVGLTNPGQGEDESSEMSIEEIFGQGFDKDLGEFENQVERYRALLGSVGATPLAVAAEAPEERPASRTKKGAGKT